MQGVNRSQAQADQRQSEKGSHVTISKVGSVEISAKDEAISNLSGAANERPWEENLVLVSMPSSEPNDLRDIPTNTNDNNNWNTNIRKIKIDFAAQKKLQE